MKNWDEVASLYTYGTEKNSWVQAWLHQLHTLFCIIKLAIIIVVSHGVYSFRSVTRSTTCWECTTGSCRACLALEQCDKELELWCSVSRFKCRPVGSKFGMVWPYYSAKRVHNVLGHNVLVYD